MTQEECARLESIDAILRSETVREQVRPIVERVRAELARKKEAAMTWEPIPLTVFGGALPGGIRSAWVFVLRAGVDTGAERHPNSHQRMMSFEGGGDMLTGEPGQWESNELISNPDASLVRTEADWAVVSFHTVPADELIEEKPDDSRKDGTKQMKYLERK